MQITFKNVGQGDSIILEWMRNGEPRLGIVDCNLYQKTNPTIQHLKKVRCTKIDFIILSHPHEDHFSGMLELLEFCDTRNIPIHTFAHTSLVHPKYLKYVNINSDDPALLAKIFHKVKALYEKELIRLIAPISQNTTIVLNHDFILKALSPSMFEMDKFNKEINDYSSTDYTKCNKAANHLSTILKICNKKEACLLTADAEKSTFKRLKQRHSEEFEDLSTIVQIPHHGSKSNHYPPFWSKLNRAHNCIAAVSVGSGQYRHPNNEVVSDFSSWGYDTYSTNRGIVFAKLDAISEVIETIDQEGDLVFEIK